MINYEIASAMLSILSVRDCFVFELLLTGFLVGDKRDSLATLRAMYSMGIVTPDIDGRWYIPE